MSDRPNNRVSMMAPAGAQKCDTCPYIDRATDRNGGWCLHPSNRVPPSNGWPVGFPPSVAWDGTCDLHPGGGK